MEQGNTKAARAPFSGANELVPEVNPIWEYQNIDIFIRGLKIYFMILALVDYICYTSFIDGKQKEGVCWKQIE